MFPLPVFPVVPVPPEFPVPLEFPVFPAPVFPDPPEFPKGAPPHCSFDGHALPVSPELSGGTPDLLGPPEKCPESPQAKKNAGTARAANNVPILSTVRERRWIHPGGRSLFSFRFVIGLGLCNRRCQGSSRIKRAKPHVVVG